jgi:outer membrane murein-binding lipoprotein Lpp
MDYYDYDDTDYTWVWWLIIPAALLGGMCLFGCFEPSTKEKEYQQRIERLEADVADIFDKLDKR